MKYILPLCYMVVKSIAAGVAQMPYIYTTSRQANAVNNCFVSPFTVQAIPMQTRHGVTYRECSAQRHLASGTWYQALFCCRF